MLHINIKRIEIQSFLNVPVDICCNCGEDDELDFYDTPLEITSGLMPLKIINLTESYYPYCPSCSMSVGQKRLTFLPAILGGLLGTCALSIILSMIIENLPLNLLMSLSLSFLCIFMYHKRLIKNKKESASYFQPVLLRGVKFRRGSVISLSLCFYNINYAQLFKEANYDFFASGKVSVKILK